MNKRNKELTLMAVHAHPDDESIGTGGILAKYSAQGTRTVLVYGTRGEAGEILNPDFVHPSPGLKIKDIRALELDKALKVLGVESVDFLEYRDSGMPGSPENHHPQAFAQADLQEATGRLVDIIRRYQPHVIVTYNERGFYGHPDHIMANRVTLRAFDTAADPLFESTNGLKPWRPKKLYYTATPIERLRMRYRMAQERGENPGFDPEVLGTPEEEITTVMDVREHLPQKLEAITCHQSQIGPNSFFRRLPKEWVEEALGYEYFVCVNGCDPSDRKETDLFEGLRD
jgi:N-acetyl-1-D-myo-inositol-2-amino-2-deoxy-alpha-D-glucopyranoside deacetylase